MLRRLLILFLALSAPAFADAIRVGSALPTLEIKEKGELLLEDDDEVTFRPWSTEQLDTTAEVQIIQYMAARPSAEKQIRPFTDALEAAEYPENLHHVSTVINLDDVTFGMSGWALSEIKENKRKYPTSTMVADWEGKGLKRWNLESKSSALFILDKEGQVLFFKDGKLNEQEIDRALKLIGEEIAKRQSS